jgi:hypothetical protein
MQSIDQESRRRIEAGKEVDIFERYNQITVPREVCAFMRKRSDTEVVFLHPKGVFELESALINRMLAYLIIKAGLVTPKLGRINEFRRVGERWQVILEGEETLDDLFDIVMPRHGPDPKYVNQQFSNVAKPCERLGQKLAQLDLGRSLGNNTIAWYSTRQLMPDLRSATRETWCREKDSINLKFSGHAELLAFTLFEPNLHKEDGPYPLTDDESSKAQVERNLLKEDIKKEERPNERHAILSREPDWSSSNSIDLFHHVEDYATVRALTKKAYPSASGSTKCCSRGGGFVIEQITNMYASGGRDDRLSPLPDRVPTALRR